MTTIDYITELSEDRKVPFQKLMTIISENLPKGFEENFIYKMPAFVVPKTLYPNGYHCAPELPLPFINLASQKKFIALYHMGLYADTELHDWFVAEYPKHCKYKLDMGKSCIRFKKMEDIPYDLIAELMKKMTTKYWIALYEKSFIKK
jgi:uncharacterized protein YdhG (YjbR/CyaY superfamily)